MKPNHSGNHSAWHGVYTSMVRGALYLLLACATFGQVRPNDPLQAKLTAIYQARTEGRFTDAAALREEARRLLESLPVDAPQFGGWARSVAQVYASGARTAQARAILESALARAGSLPATSGVRIEILVGIAEFWRQDRTLPRAAEYLAKAIAAQEAAPSGQASLPRGEGGITFTGVRMIQISGRLSSVSGPYGGLKNLYAQMSELQRELGHPVDVAAWTAKERALAMKGGDDEMVGFFEQHGQLAEAAALRKSALERASTADQAVAQLEDLARIYERQERLGEAVAAEQQAIARMESGGADLRERSWNARETLARILQQAGRMEAADAVYQDLLARGPANQQVRLVCNYAGFLWSTQHAAQALTVLEEFQASHSVPQNEESMFYFATANAARAANDLKKAAEYQALANARVQSSPDAAERAQFDGVLQRAQESLNQGRKDEAFLLAMQALGAAEHARNREAISWMVPPIASALSTHGDAARAGQLLRRAEALAESWSEDSLQPLLNVLSNEAHALEGQPDHRKEMPELIERYQRLLTIAHGADSGMLEDAMRLTVQFERMRGPASAATLAAQDLAAYEESVNGNTSEPYRQALRTLAEAYDASGDVKHAIAARRQVVQVSDLTYPADDYQRAQAGVELAMALAGLGDFDEAERLATEAVAQTKGNGFDHAIAEIHRLRAARERER